MSLVRVIIIYKMIIILNESEACNLPYSNLFSAGEVASGLDDDDEWSVYLDGYQYDDVYLRLVDGETHT